MAKQVEQAMKSQHRTRSELVREALRIYLSARLIPVEVPTAAEVRAYRRGVAAYRRGDYVTLEEYSNQTKRPRLGTWQGFFELVDTLDIPQDSIAKRSDVPPQKRKPL